VSGVNIINQFLPLTVLQNKLGCFVAGKKILGKASLMSAKCWGKPVDIKEALKLSLHKHASLFCQSDSNEERFLYQ
jgi:hypothetical protein